MKLLTVAIAASAGWVTSTQAATVVFQTPTNIPLSSTGEELVTTGNYEFGVNYGAAVDPGAPTSVTVNSETTFYTDASTNPTASSVTVSTTGTLFNPSSSPYNNKASGMTTGTDFYDVVSYGSVSDRLSNGGEFTITLNNLSIGTEYRVQFIGGQLGQQADARLFDITSGGVTSDPVDGSIQMASNIATFTADASTQDFVFAPVSGGDDSNRRAPLNAIAIYSIPEPSTTLLVMGVSALGWCLVRRRSRRGKC